VVRTSNNLKQLVEGLDVIKAQIVEQMNATKTQSKRQSRQKDDSISQSHGGNKRRNGGINLTTDQPTTETAFGRFFL
jgi:hypothetical protein